MGIPSGEILAPREGIEQSEASLLVGIVRLISMKILALLIYLLSSLSLGFAGESAPIEKYQKASETKWGEVKLDSFLSFKEWKDQSDERDAVPEWETIVKERNHKEIVGRFFQCVGICRVDRGESFFNPSFKTSLYEGDELQTIGESYAWIYLFDGTMLRLSPESSINLNELNIGVKENFLNIRMNAGNILWLSRHENLFEVMNPKETDVLFNPLALYDAIAYPDRKKYRENYLFELVEEKFTVENQYKRLNELILENNKLTAGKKTYAFIVAPNFTAMGLSPNIEVVTLIGGKSYIKKRSDKFLGLQISDEAKEEDTFVQLRGFENTDETKLESDKWFVVDEKGKSISEETENTYWLTMGEFITKRIPSLMVARELMFKEFSEFAFRKKYDPLVLARLNGYRLWGSLDDPKSDLSFRISFLKEYFRRIETTNLVVSSQFSNRLKDRGEAIKAMEYGNFFFIKALNTYYSYEDPNSEPETGEILNSTQKILWKRMHGIK